MRMRAEGHREECTREECVSSCPVLECLQLGRKVRRLANPEDWLCCACSSADCDGCGGYRRHTEWQAFGEWTLYLTFTSPSPR